MTNWSSPTTSTAYTTVLADLKGRDDNAATMFSEALTAATNVPTEAVKWSSSNKKFQRWTGVALGDFTTDYAIDVASVGGIGLAGLLRNNPGTNQTITSGKLIIDTAAASPFDLKSGAANHVYIQFFADAAAQSTRSAYIGFPTAGSHSLTIGNDYTTGNLDLWTNGIVRANGNQVITVVGGQTISGTLTTTGAITEIGTALSAKYLGIAATASNSQLLDSLDSTQFLRSDISDSYTGDTITFTDDTILKFGTTVGDPFITYNSIANYLRIDAANAPIHIQDNGFDRVIIDPSAQFIDFKSMEMRVDNIKFPATQVASADPNTLDDYQEGTWVPELHDGTLNGSLGQTYGSQVGDYVKIGNTVFFSFQMQMTGLGTLQTTSASYVANLPFTVTFSGAKGSVSLVTKSMNLSSGSPVAMQFIANSTRAILSSGRATFGDVNISISEIGVNGLLSGSGFYKI